ncbi:hypothetical protein TSUD_317700 [Trifolium subterraneum]|uniref:Uncharacterized protein n=1 Tax=Trifolium subterraneum TaxID=3900 RepID=A0A2Z6MNE9_TRISU|nr:hypothetical protein TSUD_317700 [Trifolium subterraneum]
MSSLQRDSLSEEEDEEPWKDYGVMVKEILQERREDVERGRIKGRRLFESTSESESDHDNDDDNVVSQREVRSMSFSYSGDEDEDEDEHELLGSSLFSPIGDFVDKDMVDNIEDIRVGSYKSRFIHGTRYGGFLGGFVIFVFLIVAICISLRISYGGHDFDDTLVPT